MIPHHNDVYTPACRVYTSLTPFRMGNYPLRETHDLADGDQRLLRDTLAKDIVPLCDLAHKAPLLPAVNQ